MTAARKPITSPEDWLAGRDAAVEKLRSLADLYQAYSERYGRNNSPEREREMWNYSATILDAIRAIESDVKP